MSTLEEEIRRIVREEIARARPPVFPGALPEIISSRCPVCKIDFGSVPMAYVCSHADCPNMARAS